VEAVGFPVQNVYKMTYGDENATFEPLNLWTRERLQKQKPQKTLPNRQGIISEHFDFFYQNILLLSIKEKPGQQFSL